MERAINFNAGPAALPLAALERAREELLDFAGTGMSVMEHSHRGKDYERVHDEAIALLRETASIGDDTEVLFIQGGASQQFAQIPLNFLPDGGSADYVVHGAWGEKAVSEAQAATKWSGGKVRVAATTAQGKQYTRVPTPSEIQLDPKAAYLHLTSNETIHGVQFHEFPDAGKVPLVCDMSSDFLWRKTDLSRFSFIYAGAQKNVGPSGIVIVLAKKDFIAQGRKDLPKIFQYRTVAENNSLYNTPPTFAIYLIRNVLAWIKETGGLSRIEEQNRKKAALIYGVLDEHAGFYASPVERASRSTMNIVFRLPSDDHEARFLAEAKKLRMVGLKGHRSVGGIRASLYNAVSLEWTTALADFMRDFAKRG
ncbi:3-phosphoserine/phosphohydroxythreonine transaminase [Pendulispora brunnea]|uniref:Phosphoserine aminotransferase n=1 Tax=Pendulispora brunnea TaxID=2905690 RepID=A0ABZ2KFD1_9BACT